jgi:medium-chain acyl-[acyl-carrier-protein] hydrolase
LPWFIPSHRRPPASTRALRLFAFPYAGRGASLYFPWRAVLPDWIELVAVQLPGREGRLAEPALDRLEVAVAALVEAIAPLLDRPYAFFGHSMGALLCYELACALAARNAPEPVALALSGRRAPTTIDADPLLHLMPDDAFINALRARYDGIPQAVLDEPELLRLALPTLRRDIELIETHVPYAHPPLAAPFLLYGGDADPLTPPETLTAWRPLTKGDAPLRLFPGGHFYLQSQQPSLLDDLTRQLARHFGKSARS